MLTFGAVAARGSSSSVGADRAGTHESLRRLIVSPSIAVTATTRRNRRASDRPRCYDRSSSSAVKMRRRQVMERQNIRRAWQRRADTPGSSSLKIGTMFNAS